MPTRKRGGKGGVDRTTPQEPATTSRDSKKQSAEYDTLKKKLQQRESLRGPLPIITSILMGIVFGFALNKGRVAEPVVIQDQFKFVRWTMMKMFLAAASTSAITLALLASLFKTHFQIERNRYRNGTNIAATVIGALILGAGMAIGGACPGMVLIQVGAGVPNSIITLLGALTGAFVYGLTEPLFRGFFSSNSFKTTVFLDEALGIDYSLLAFIFGTLMMLFSIFLDTIFPWESELIKANEANCSLLGCRSWSPIFAGIFVGFLQIPCVLLLGNTIGGASSYVAVTGQWIRFMPESVQNYFKHFTVQLNRLWQVLYVVSAILGSTLAVYVGGGNVYGLIFNGESFDDITGNTWNKAFLGGFLMIYGARLAKGCTSGHGLSGMGLLNIASFIAVAAMFGGGGIVGLTMEHVLKM